MSAGITATIPSLLNTQIRYTLGRSALDLGEPSRDREYGYGLVQAKDALDYVLIASTTTIGGD